MTCRYPHERGKAHIAEYTSNEDSAKHTPDIIFLRAKRGTAITAVIPTYNHRRQAHFDGLNACRIFGRSMGGLKGFGALSFGAAPNIF